MMNARKAAGSRLYSAPCPSGMRPQRGVVLFISLIALVAMTLAAIALVRSVDTTTMISGNLAFKQAATVSGDIGIERAISWVYSKNDATLNSDSPSNGYYSTGQDTLDLTGNRTASTSDNLDWSSASKLVGSGADSSGNEVRYVVHRLCRNPGVPTDPATGCLLSSVTSVKGDSQRVLREDEVGLSGTGAVSGPYYRVTVKVSGPRNTISYIQAIIY